MNLLCKGGFPEKDVVNLLEVCQSAAEHFPHVLDEKEVGLSEVERGRVS